MLRPYATDSSPSSSCPPVRPSICPPKFPTRHRRRSLPPARSSSVPTPRTVSGRLARLYARCSCRDGDMRRRAATSPGRCSRRGKASPPGVFDSGIGGHSVARAVFERLPHESVIYFGDTARVPYGPKSPDTVRRYSGEILTYLLQRGVKALVVACITISAQALEFLWERSPVPLVGVIEPGARAAVQGTRSGRIGVIGTAGTIARGAYERAIKQLRPHAPGCVQACPPFVPLVEEGWVDPSAAEPIPREYLA